MTATLQQVSCGQCVGGKSIWEAAFLLVCDSSNRGQDVLEPNLTLSSWFLLLFFFFFFFLLLLLLLTVSHGAFGDSDQAHRIDVSLKPRTDLVARRKALQLYLQNGSAQNFDGSVVCSQFCGNLQYRNPPALPACLVEWGLMTDCLSVLCFCLYSLS